MKLSRLEKNLSAATVVLVMAAVMAYLMKSAPEPSVSIKFQGYRAKTIIFDLAPATNEEGQFCYESRAKSANDPNWWFSCLPSSKKLPLKQTNVLCELYFTNHGPTQVWWTALDCRVEARTPNGYITNVFAHFTTAPSSIGASGTEIFEVYTPVDAVEWRVSGSCSYFKARYPIRLLLWKILGDLHLSQNSESAFEVLDLAPDPNEEYTNVFSEYFTNSPPSSIAP